MKRIVECLLEAGIMEEDIHRILDLIEEEYEVVDETIEDQVEKKYGYSKSDFEDGYIPSKRARELYTKIDNAKYNLKTKGQGTQHTETKNSKGEDKVLDKLERNVLNRTPQVDNILRYVPMTNAVDKSKMRHTKKLIKNEIRNMTEEKTVGDNEKEFADGMKKKYTKIVSVSTGKTNGGTMKTPKLRDIYINK